MRAITVRQPWAWAIVHGARRLVYATAAERVLWVHLADEIDAYLTDHDQPMLGDS